MLLDVFVEAKQLLEHIDKLERRIKNLEGLSKIDSIVGLKTSDSMEHKVSVIPYYVSKMDLELEEPFLKLQTRMLREMIYATIVIKDTLKAKFKEL